MNFEVNSVDIYSTGPVITNKTTFVLIMAWCLTVGGGWGVFYGGGHLQPCGWVF